MYLAILTIVLHGMASVGVSNTPLNLMDENVPAIKRYHSRGKIFYTTSLENYLKAILKSAFYGQRVLFYGQK